VRLSGRSNLSEENDHMDDTSKDLSFFLNLLSVIHSEGMVGYLYL
jgi:hypothetical protein